MIRSTHGPSPGLFAIALLQRDGTVCTDPKGVSVVMAASDSRASRG